MYLSILYNTLLLYAIGYAAVTGLRWGVVWRSRLVSGQWDSNEYEIILELVTSSDTSIENSLNIIFPVSRQDSILKSFKNQTI